MLDFKFKEKYSTDDLLHIMRLLRSEDGCPWDRVQTHQTIRGNVLEEAYEVADAIDCGDSSALCEELGDLLMQVVFHAVMAEEEHSFTMDDIADGVCKKLINRHPHVFGSVNADTVDKVLDNWDAIKREEKHQQTYTDTLKSVPRAFPSLLRAAKVQKRAAKAGFDWDSADGAWDKLDEEISELRGAVSRGNTADIEEELGDLLFSAVNVSRFLGVDAEQALARSTDKFTDRFEAVEKLAVKRGIDMKNSSLAELDRLWDEVKQHS
jgi:tetrapyrrole methylase family protein/MazG family protein